MLNPLHLRTLREVVRTGSFAAAAKSLGYTASAVSQQVAALERATDVALFERTPRSIRTTAAARLLAEKSESILVELELLEGEVRRAGGRARQRIRVGSFASAARHIVPAAFAAILTDDRTLDLTVKNGEPTVLVPELVDGSLDLAVVHRYGPAAGDWPDELVATRVMTERLRLLAPEGHPAARGAAPARVDFAALKDDPWIASTEEYPQHRVLVGLCATAGFTPQIAVHVRSLDVAPALVAAGVGLAVVPAMGYEDRPGVRAVELEHPSARRHTVALRRRDDLDPLLGLLLRRLVDVASGLDAAVAEEKNRLR